MEALEKGSQEKESVTQHCCDAVQDKAGRVQELEGSLAILEAQHTSLAEEADSREAQACYFPCCSLVMHGSSVSTVSLFKMQRGRKVLDGKPSQLIAKLQLILSFHIYSDGNPRHM